MYCKCTMSQRLTGDGCEICNPAQALEYAKETISDLEAERDRLKAAFDDRVRVIELQLEDKRQMQELIDQYREALELISEMSKTKYAAHQALIIAVDTAKQTLEASDVD